MCLYVFSITICEFYNQGLCTRIFAEIGIGPKILVGEYKPFKTWFNILRTTGKQRERSWPLPYYVVAEFSRRGLSSQKKIEIFLHALIF